MTEGFFDFPPAWREHWRGMPGFNQADLTPMQSVVVSFRCPRDREEFAELIGRRITGKTRSMWYPREEIGRMVDKRFASDEPLNPRYPVYVISKGRWESSLTAKALERMGVPFKVAVEPQELDRYSEVIDPRKILTLPFSDLGKGSIPARNWVWGHAVEAGAERHWILDDNISGFYRLFDNIKVPAACGNIFRAAEDFADRYENVALAGFNYFMFASRKSVVPPFYLNTRIYSCILIKNDLPYGWRGRYNEDTDLSLRALKDGWCTVLFNAFLAMKATTMSMKGGNTDELYQGDGRWRMAESLRLQHPDCVAVAKKWGRWQHHVDYRRFGRNKLKLCPGAFFPDGENNYGMHLEHLSEEDGREEAGRRLIAEEEEREFRQNNS